MASMWCCNWHSGHVDTIDLPVAPCRGLLLSVNQRCCMAHDSPASIGGAWLGGPCTTGALGDPGKSPVPGHNSRLAGALVIGEGVAHWPGSSQQQDTKQAPNDSMAACSLPIDVARCNAKVAMLIIRRNQCLNGGRRPSVQYTLLSS